MDDIPPTKRRRTDDAAEETPLVRSTEYWFDDGNIILQVESTQFRLTKSMLSMHSSVFRDMFMMPLPPDEPTVESCPVVVLSGDTPEDWIHLLSAMYPKFLMTETPRLEFLAAILRLGKKYDFPLFRKDAMCRLKAEFPATLKGHIEMKPWTNVQEEAEDFMMLSVISLAREIGLHSILPATYYYIVSDKDYMDKILHDEELALNTTDRLVCLQGYIKALELQSQNTMAWLGLDGGHLPAEGCDNFDNCKAAVKEISYEMSKGSRPDVMGLYMWDNDWESGMCSHCIKEAKAVFESGREQCWEELPSVFGLPSWKELKSLDFE